MVKTFKIVLDVSCERKSLHNLRRVTKKSSNIFYAFSDTVTPFIFVFWVSTKCLQFPCFLDPSGLSPSCRFFGDWSFRTLPSFPQALYNSKFWLFPQLCIILLLTGITILLLLTFSRLTYYIQLEKFDSLKLRYLRLFLHWL